MKAMKDFYERFGRKDFGRNVSRVQFIDIIVPTAWLIDGELWRFRPGTELFIGPQNDLDAAQPVVIACVALSLINAGKAQPSDTTALEEFDMEELG